MALKRLDEEFDLKPGTQLLPYMQRLLPSLEGRFQDIEADQDVVNKLAAEIRAAALLRMNEILIPATEDIIAITKLGFLLAPISTPYTLVMGYMAMFVDEGPQRDAFTPSPYLIIEHTQNDYAIARLIGYHQEDGLLEVTITAIHGNAGPWSDWMVSSTPGMADSTKLYHDEVGPWRDEVAADHTDVVRMHQEILDAVDALEGAGLDLFNYIRRDGTVNFTGLQHGVAPPTGSNDTTLATTAWSRARMQEYVGQAMQRTGDTMSGPLILNTSAPTAALQAASKGYVDNAANAGHYVNDYLGIRGISPAVLLQTTGTGQNRIVQGNTPSGVPRWQMFIGASDAESGGDVGSNFILYRYNDAGNVASQALFINRANGDASLNGALNVNKSGTFGGTVVANGDLRSTRPAAVTTGCLYLGNGATAYHFFDGTTHAINGGPVTINGNSFACGPLSCNALTTNGYGATVWGITSHGPAQINSSLNCTSLQINSTGPMIQMQDTDWGPMYIHHNADLIGFLSNGGGWVMYATNAGHIWTPQYGWIHDYVNGQANAYAWGAADYRYNQLVANVRMVYVGTAGQDGCVMINTAIQDTGYGYYAKTDYFNVIQVLIAGNWYTIHTEG